MLGFLHNCSFFCSFVMLKIDTKFEKKLVDFNVVETGTHPFHTFRYHAKDNHAYFILDKVRTVNSNILKHGR